MLGEYKGQSVCEIVDGSDLLVRGCVSVSVGGSFGVYVGLSVGSSVGQSIGQSVGLSVDPLVGRSVHWLFGDWICSWFIIYNYIGNVG